MNTEAYWEDTMHSIMKTSFAAYVAAGVTAQTAVADGHSLYGELNIISDL